MHVLLSCGATCTSESDSCDILKGSERIRFIILLFENCKEADQCQLWLGAAFLSLSASVIYIIDISAPTAQTYCVQPRSFTRYVLQVFLCSLSKETKLCPRVRACVPNTLSSSWHELGVQSLPFWKLTRAQSRTSLSNMRSEI